MKRMSKLLILILVLAVLYGGFRVLESSVFYRRLGNTTIVPTKTITREDDDYFPRQDITVILIMGIDQMGPVQDSGDSHNAGEADMVALVILDQADETYSILTLNRDMMLEMPVIEAGGRQTGSIYGQLARSHTYGSGLEDSAENTRRAVSDLLHSITIDHYIALNMDAFGILHDAVGGVAVTVTEDFSRVDETLTAGEVTLTKEQALAFVRTRQNADNQLRTSRTQRHQEYLLGLMDALGEKRSQSDTFAAELYEQMSDYMVTDCSVNVVSGLLQRCGGYELKQIIAIEGEERQNGETWEFYANAEKLDALTLELFYAPKN